MPVGATKITVDAGNTNDWVDVINGVSKPRFTGEIVGIGDEVEVAVAVGFAACVWVRAATNVPTPSVMRAFISKVGSPVAWPLQETSNAPDSRAMTIFLLICINSFLNTRVVFL